MAARRDTARWHRPVHDFDGIEALESAVNVPAGIIAVKRAGTYIDTLFEPAGAETTIILFHAALSRPEFALPYFTGNAVTQDGPVNRIFVGDSGLYADEGLTLTWYAGTRALPLQ